MTAVWAKLGWTRQSLRTLGVGHLYYLLGDRVILSPPTAGEGGELKRELQLSISAAHLLVASRQGRSGSLPSQGVPCPHHPTTHDDVTSVPLASYRAPPVAAAGCIVDFRRVSPMAGEPPRQCGTSRAGLGGCSTVDTSRCDACAHRGCPIIQTDCFYGMPHAAALPALMPLSPARDSC